MPQLTYLEAIRQGIWEEMERDPAVFCIGEDIGIYGGAFKVTDGLIDRFGPERVVDTPISEMAIINASFGAGLTGLRPVAEFQFMDFISCAFNQIRTICWPRRIFAGERPCRWWFAAPPAAGFTAVLFIAKSRDLLRAYAGSEGDLSGQRLRREGSHQVGNSRQQSGCFSRAQVSLSPHQGRAPADDYTVSIGNARVVREGRDVSVITYAAMVLSRSRLRDILALDLNAVLP